MLHERGEFYNLYFFLLRALGALKLQWGQPIDLFDVQTTGVWFCLPTQLRNPNKKGVSPLKQVYCRRHLQQSVCFCVHTIHVFGRSNNCPVLRQTLWLFGPRTTTSGLNFKRFFSSSVIGECVCVCLCVCIYICVYERESFVCIYMCVYTCL
jgi:hypothetical protein